MRRAVIISLLWALSPSSARAQVSSGVDLQALALPLSSSPASVLESSISRERGSFSWTLRTSGLSRPLSFRYPTPAPEGATAQIVSGVVISELATIVGLGSGFDAAFGFGAHLHQSGPATTPDASANSIRFAARDPRIGLGFSHQIQSLHVRPFAHFYLPVGDTQAFAGESSMRGKFGSAVSFTTSRLNIHSELAFIARRPVQISASTWGPQLFVGAGASVRVYGALSAQTEVVLLPVLSRQATLSGQQGGHFLPAETLASLSYSWKRLSWGLGAGLGLPLSRTSSAHLERKYVRGPTTPTYRAFADMTLHID